MAIVCGVEEAGRGPVIGPMVMSAVCIDEKDEEKLKEMGVKDSKLLSPKQREALFEKIKNVATKFEIVILAPAIIDSALDDPNMNLNLLEAKTTAELITAVKPDKAILDCPSNNIKAYVQDVKRFLGNQKVAIVAEHKADVNHLVVGAASILAKVTRDREILKIQKEIGIDFGSGYPSDPVTVEFLEKNGYIHHKIFRKTWATYKKFIAKKKQSKLDDYD